MHDTPNAVADELLALALEEICRRAPAVDRHSTRPPRVEATIILNPNDSSGGPFGVSAVRDLLGSPLPAVSVPTFLCDPVLHAALIDSLGIPIDMGRATRTATPAQRRALTLRDGGCTFPGCDCPAAWADAHHLRHWKHGGTTTLTNLILLC